MYNPSKSAPIEKNHHYYSPMPERLILEDSPGNMEPVRLREYVVNRREWIMA